jgi:hypothetical protein
MKTKITITLDQARSWFKSGNKELRELALQAFDKDALVGSFRDITTFEKACKVLGLHHGASDVDFIATISIASAAMFKLNIIRRALNLGYDMHFAKNPRNSFLYYPYNPLVTIPEGYNYYKEQLNSGILQVTGMVKIEGVRYGVLSGYVTYDINSGLGDFNYQTGVCKCHSDVSFLGCATKEIAKHFGKYFGMLITEAKYGDFEVIESKYII